MKLLAVFLLVSSAVVQASANFCPSGWTPINSRCFLYVPNDMTWTNAERNCLAIGANLASVHNTDEYRQIQNLIAAAGHGSNEAWIGGTDAQQWDNWLWSDGRPMVYTNWCRWQPDNFLSIQHCLVMNSPDGKCWDDIKCDIYRPSVCVKKSCPQ